MSNNKWSVTRHKSNDNFTYPANKFRFETKIVAKMIYNLFKIEAVLTNGPRPMLSYIPKFCIDTTLDVQYRDIGPWRSYQLYTTGDSLDEMIKNATVSEIDQDGGDLDTYELNDCTTKVELECLELIHAEVLKKIT
jgi:hypothetical protein